MNLASRCREAITQAANMKRDLSTQKRKTAEAVAQTHLLLDQLKKMKQQQKEDETKFRSLPQVQGSPQSNERTIVAGESTTVPTDEVTSKVAASESKSHIDEDTIVPIVLADSNKRSNPSEEDFQPSASNKVVPPTTTTSSDIIDNDHLDHVPLPNDTVHDNDAILKKDNEGNLMDIKAGSTSPTSPTGSKNKPLHDVSTPTIINSNVVDLDVSYFGNDHEETITNDEIDANHPVDVVTMSDDVLGKTIAEPIPLPPPEPTIENDSVPSDDELKLASSDVMSTEYSMNGTIMEPTNMDEFYFGKNNSTHPPTSNDDDIGNDKNRQIDTTNIPPPPYQKRTVLTIMTTPVSDEEYDYDDSEHKCDDISNDLYATVVEPPITTKPAIPTTVPNVLISSDDYEGASVMDENCDDDTDLGSDKHIMNDEVVVMNLDDIDSTEQTSLNDPNVKIACAKEASNPLPPPTASSQLSVPMDDINNSTDAHIGLTDVVPIPFNVPKEDIPKPKDLWLEDYDEAAVLGYGDDDDESSDTLSVLVSSSDNINNSPVKTEYFPHSASPKVSAKSNSTERNMLQSESLPMPTTKNRFMLPPPSSLMNESYEDEFPSDIIDPHTRYTSNSRSGKKKLVSDQPNNGLSEEVSDIDTSPSLKFFGPLQDRNQATNLISSIDAFEASFQTSFPESFSQKESPSSSPSSDVKPISDVSASSMNGPFVTNISLLRSVRGLDDLTSDEVTRPAADEVTPSSDEELKTPSGGTLASYTAALLHNSPRNGVKSSVDLSVDDAVLSPKNTKPSTQLDLSSIHFNSTLSTGVISDQSTRWLMEVKASTEKLKYCTETNIEALARELETAHLQTPVEETISVTGSASPVGLSTKGKSSLLTSTIAKPQESTRPVQVSEPVFRQFPRTATPVKPIKHISSNTSRINFMDDTFSIHNSDKAPLLNGRASDEYSSPQSTSLQQKLSGNSNGSMRSRYVSALGQTSAALPSERGRLSLSRRTPPNVNSSESATPSSLSKSVTETKDHGTVNSRNLAVNVRERAAIYSKVSSPPVVVSPGSNKSRSNSTTSTNPYNNRSNFRGVSRSTVRLLEDEGDIPMQTSLSPRKLRNADYSQTSRMNQTQQNGGTEKDEVSGVDAVENLSKNYQRLTESANTKVLEHIDVGKQRRHINLSGRGRLPRTNKDDHENETAHIHENGH